MPTRKRTALPPPSRPDFDQALKQLLLRAHDGFLGLVAPELTWRANLSPELPAVARQADIVWQVEGPGGRRGILHVELRTKPEANIGERMAEYLLRLHAREHQDMRSIVVFLRPARRTPSSPFVIGFMGQASIRHDFDVVRLWEIPPDRVLETPNVELWPLARVMAGVTPQAVIEVAERITEAPLPLTERSELAGLLILLAGLRVPRQALADALRRSHMIKDIWKESSFAEAVHDILVEDARAEGKAQGKAEGILTVLEARFGALEPDIRAAIGRADAGALDELLMHAALDTLPAFRARLGLG